MKTSDKLKELTIALGALAAGAVVRKMLESGYKNMYDEEPPSSVLGSNVPLTRALGWVLISGIVVSGTRMLIKRSGGKRIETEER